MTRLLLSLTFLVALVPVAASAADFQLDLDGDGVVEYLSIEGSNQDGWSITAKALDGKTVFQTKQTGLNWDPTTADDPTWRFRLNPFELDEEHANARAAATQQGTDGLWLMHPGGPAATGTVEPTAGSGPARGFIMTMESTNQPGNSGIEHPLDYITTMDQALIGVALAGGDWMFAKVSAGPIVAGSYVFELGDADGDKVYDRLLTYVSNGCVDLQAVGLLAPTPHAGEWALFDDTLGQLATAEGRGAAAAWKLFDEGLFDADCPMGKAQKEQLRAAIAAGNAADMTRWYSALRAPQTSNPGTYKLSATVTIGAKLWAARNGDPDGSRPDMRLVIQTNGQPVVMTQYVTDKSTVTFETELAWKAGETVKVSIQDSDFTGMEELFSYEHTSTETMPLVGTVDVPRLIGLVGEGTTMTWTILSAP